MMGRELTLEDIAANPEKFGLPTFDEFCKNPDKYRIRDDDTLICVEDGVNVLRRDVRKQIYHILGYKVDTLEKVEQVAKDHGWNMSQMDIKPNLERVTAGKYDIHVHFVVRGNEKAQGREKGATDGTALR